MTQDGEAVIYVDINLACTFGFNGLAYVRLFVCAGFWLEFCCECGKGIGNCRKFFRDLLRVLIRRNCGMSFLSHSGLLVRLVW